MAGGTFLALLLSASSLEALRFSPAAIIAFRIVAFLVFAALVVVGLVLPLRRQVTDGQVALYLEERDPTLEAAILSAIDSAAAESRGIDPNHRPSPLLVERQDLRAVHEAAAGEGDHVRLRLAPGAQRRGPLLRAAQLVGGLAPEDHAAVDDAAHDRREVASGDGQHGLVEPERPARQECAGADHRAQRDEEICSRAVSAIHVWLMK